MKKMRPTTALAKKRAKARENASDITGMLNVECLMLNVECWRDRHSTFNIQHSTFPSLPSDLGKKCLTRNGPPQKPLHQIPSRLLASAGEDHRPEAAAGLLVHHVGTEGGDQVEGDDLGPHVAVVAGG